MSIADNLKEFIEIKKIESKINDDNYCTLIFKVQDGKIMRFEKQFAINAEDVKIGGSE